MLLRRFYDHVSTQSWVAVALDLVVVVVGVFLAFQVERWYDDRRSDSMEEEYLASLAGDFAATGSDLDRIKQIHVRASEAALVLLGLDEVHDNNIGHDAF